MEGAGGTASLRKAAAHWSLAGDKQLLDLLQNLQERIVTKCQEANSGLEEMVNALDSASISLQNVNNRLMALSNSQFVESRVYEDDVDVAARDPPVKAAAPPADPAAELARLRGSLRVLEGYHETVHILDSDSESASDEEEDRMVLKPKDLYPDRPLPYIIGSQQWRSKWHAGLVVEESDTDSDTSKANPPSEEYSDSEPDAGADGGGGGGGGGPPDRPHASQRTISTNSSIGSELTIPTMGKPADIAAELARRLGGNVPHIPEPEPEPPAAAAPTRVYRPQQPTTATIFSDEPPPLDSYQSDHSDQPDEPYQSDSEDDVFAELHRQAHRQTDRPTGGVDQLFGNVSNVYGRKGDFIGDVDRGRQTNLPVKQSSPRFEEPQDSELFGDKPKSEKQPVYTEPQPDVSIKKPVGGISLFGNNHGTESIGAAILKRNPRKASTSDEEVQQPQQVRKINDETEKTKARAGQNSKDNIQKDIINDLFSKPSKTKQTNKKVEISPPTKEDKPANKKVDLFTDDLFDDIDDIFTNVKPPVKESKQSTKKSLFDDDDDDLFANVASTSNKTSSKPEPISKSIFDSDDDLFSEDIVENNTPKLSYISKSSKGPIDVNDDDLFSEAIDNTTKVLTKTDIQTKPDQNTTTAIKIHTKGLETEHEDSRSKDSETCPEEVKSVQGKDSLKGSQTISIFDSDSDDDIFSGLKSRNNNSITQKIVQKNAHNINNTAQFANNIDEYTVSKTESRNIPISINNENQLNSGKDGLLEDDALFKERENPLDVKDILTPYNEKNDTENNANVYESEDNNKKTDEALPENLDVSSEIESNTAKENNTIIYTEDKFVSSSNNYESILQNKEVSSHLSNNISQKTFNSVHSPSVFEEDDDIDDMFSKSSDSYDSKKGDNKLKQTSINQSSTFTTNQDTISENRRQEEIINKSDIDDVPTENSNLIASVGESQIFQSDKVKKQVLENDKPHVFKDASQDLRYESNTNNVSNSLVKSEKSLAKANSKDNSISIQNESILGEEKENKTDDDNISEDFEQRENLFFNIKETVLGEPDIFSDIFSDVPPEFERPKEPKRSKNVNALFDDDSDDEALFFKKNEIVSDDIPDVTFSAQDDKLFHIFHDEPPAIDVDFTQKSIKSLETPHTEKNASQTDIQANVKTLVKEGLQKEKGSDTSIDLESEKITDEARKPVRKLKPVNFNINVNSLLPGASPKKTKTYEQVDGQVVSSKSSEDAVREKAGMVKSVSFEGDPDSEVLDNKLSKERVKIQVKRRPSTRRARKEAVRKSGIDFGDDSTDTSTSTDISKKDNRDKPDVSRTDNNKQTSENRTTTATKEDKVVGKSVITALDQKNSYIVDQDEDTDLSDVREEKQVKSVVEQNTQLLSNVETNTTGHIKHSDSSTSDRVKQEESESSNLTTAFNKRPNVKSKVVYILNDEDIFTDTKPVTNLLDSIHKVSENAQSNSNDVFKDTKIITNIPENTQLVKNKVLNIVDDDDELFKSGASKSANVSTLGNVYKEVNLKNNEIGDLDSDEDIFKASQSKSVKNSENITSSKSNHEIDKMEAKIDKLFVKSQSTKVKSSLFDDLSDEESELFGSKKSVKKQDPSNNSDDISTIIKKEVKLPKNDTKRSLFGDESDDDDLFGVRTTKKVPSQPPSKPKEVTSKPAEPVFEDPLSILTQEDDI